MYLSNRNHIKYTVSDFQGKIEKCISELLTIKRSNQTFPNHRDNR